jgi:hypothetical protein
MVRLFKTGWQGADFDPAQSVECLGMGFNHWFGRGARLVLGGPINTTGEPLPRGRGAPSPAAPASQTALHARSTNPLAVLRPAGVACRYFVHVPQLEAILSDIVLFAGQSLSAENCSIGLDKALLHSLRG